MPKASVSPAYGLPWTTKIRGIQPPRLRVGRRRDLAGVGAVALRLRPDRVESADPEAHSGARMTVAAGIPIEAR